VRRIAKDTLRVPANSSKLWVDCSHSPTGSHAVEVVYDQLGVVMQVTSECDANSAAGTSALLGSKCCLRAKWDVQEGLAGRIRVARHHHSKPPGEVLRPEHFAQLRVPTATIRLPKGAEDRSRGPLEGELPGVTARIRRGLPTQMKFTFHTEGDALYSGRWAIKSASGRRVVARRMEENIWIFTPFSSEFGAAAGRCHCCGGKKVYRSLSRHQRSKVHRRRAAKMLRKAILNLYPKHRHFNIQTPPIAPL